MAEQTEWLDGQARIRGSVEKICPKRHIRQYQWQSDWNKRYCNQWSKHCYDYISDYECIFEHPLETCKYCRLKAWDDLQAAKQRGTHISIANLAHVTKQKFANKIITSGGFSGGIKKYNKDVNGHDVKAKFSWWSPIFGKDDIKKVRNTLGKVIKPFIAERLDQDDNDEDDEEISDRFHGDDSDQDDGKHSDQDIEEGGDGNYEEGSDQNDEEGDDQDNDLGSDQDNEEGSGQNDEEGDDQDNDLGSDQDNEAEGSDQGDEEDNDQDGEKDSVQDIEEGSEQNDEEGSQQMDEGGSKQNDKAGSDKDDDDEDALTQQFATSEAFYPNARYGSCYFQYDINRLCDYYGAHFNGEVQFKILGTFSYKQEVMHAVLVCSQENGYGLFREYPHVNNEAVVTRDNDGKWIWKPQATGTEIKRLRGRDVKPMYRRWEHVAFAFHLPEDQQLMKVPELSDNLHQIIKKDQ